MKKILSALAAVVFFALVLGAGAALAADTGSNELFRYDPDTGRIIGSFESEAVSVEIYLDNELKHFKKLNVPVDEGTHLIQVYEEGVLVYSQIIEVIFETPSPQVNGLDFNRDGAVDAADAVICIPAGPGYENGAGRTVYDAVRVLQFVVGLKSE